MQQTNRDSCEGFKMKLTKFLILGASALVLIACQSEVADKVTAKTTDKAADIVERVTAESDINVRLDAWFAEYEEARLLRFPETLTSRGSKLKNDEWNDGSKSFYLAELDRRRQAVDELKANFDRAELNAQSQLSYDLFIDQANRSMNGQEWFYHNYDFTQMRGVHSSIPTFLLNNHKIDTLDDAKAYISRLQKVDTKLGQALTNSQKSFEAGIMPPLFVYDHVLRTIDNVTSGAPFDDSEKLNLILNDFKNKTSKLELSDPEKEALYMSAITALMENYKPAYDAVRAEMVKQQAVATTEDGAWKLPDGTDYYAYRLNLMTTTDMSPSEVHDLGLAEVDRIHGEMRDIMKKVNFDGTLQDFFEFTRTDPQFYYLDEGGKERYLKEATEFIDIMKSKIDTVFIQKPKADTQAKPFTPAPPPTALARAITTPICIGWKICRSTKWKPSPIMKRSRWAFTKTPIPTLAASLWSFGVPRVWSSIRASTIKNGAARKR